MFKLLKKKLGRKVKRDSVSEKDLKNDGSGGEDFKAGQISKPGPWMQSKRGPLKAEERQRLLVEQKKDIELVDILSRIVDSGAGTAAAIHTQQGKKGRNQDAMLVWEDFLDLENTSFVGVFDGHGPLGHLVAKRVRDSLPSIVAHYLSAILGHGGSKKQAAVPPKVFQEGEIEKLKAAFKGAFLEMDSELRNHPTIDSFCSGTTAICAVRHREHLFVANLGDSRLILGSLAPNGSLEASQLSVDLKPDLPDEKRRIRASTGRVFALPDEPDVTRVWLPHEDTPGLAMARAFGDLCLKDYGVIAAPEVTHHTLTEADKFIVLASDGVWDVLENSEVVELVASTAPRKSAAAKVIQTAVRTWREKFPLSKTDDCACVVHFLDGDLTDGPIRATSAEVSTPEKSPVTLSHPTMGPALVSRKSESELPEESLIARADSVVNIAAIQRAMEDDGPEEEEDTGNALVARADSVTHIARKL